MLLHVHFALHFRLRPCPETLITLNGHHRDNNLSIPGIRTGSEIRVLHQMQSHNLAVLDWVAVSGCWGFFFVVVDGKTDCLCDGFCRASGIQLGVLRTPLELVDPSVADGYFDIARFPPTDLDMDFFPPTSRFTATLAFPANHKYSVTEHVEHHVPDDLALTPEFRVTRQGRRRSQFCQLMF